MLVSRPGLGDDHAFDVLVARHHGAVALLARLVAPEERRRSLVVETFDVAHAALRRMLGPTESLRPLLLMTACWLHEEHPYGLAVSEHFPSGVPFREPRPGAMHPAVSGEFSRLPEAWQLLVWQLEVERDTVEDAAALIGVSPVVVSALVEGARSAWRTRCASAAVRARVPGGWCCGTRRSASGAPYSSGTSTPSSGTLARWRRGTGWAGRRRTTWRYAAPVWPRGR